MSKAFQASIRKFACDQEYYGAFRVQGFTRMNIRPANSEAPVNFHASEYLRGGPWYDFGMVQFEEDDVPKSDTTCPAKIYGYFRYMDPGVPTPHFVYEEGLDNDEIYDQFLRKDWTMMKFTIDSCMTRVCTQLFTHLRIIFRGRKWKTSLLSHFFLVISIFAYLL